ncbi:uncharacterized protein K452DRAFT_301168 [Aplosporella prunicola CBS 121167]|uniref:Knr4/Smi1-like domain-containing protein n=1 Tax=Aplosporella prunicola CBS 121167 TaxID=1176127 RepID=A0A6A6B1W4_9PEZI|nr:uncharacterized protein K452DRAFT_301168 [Aplosporella prunicola CBS 121167]KAF2138202.1 hypothetical protein K452DRAFT_301168 [Aplosporella prunicola CBS 121167]
MQYPTEVEIISAIDRYRQEVEQHNRRAFTRFVEHAESAGQNTAKSLEQISEARQRFLYRLLCFSRPERLPQSLCIDTPADVFTKWTQLVRAFELDGVRIGEDGETRAEQREVYKRGIMNGLQDTTTEYQDETGEDAELEFPQDFWSLMGVVDSLVGHGWPQYREEGQQIRFWDGLGEEEGEVEDRLVDPEDIAEQLEEWDVMAGWESGSGPETTCYILFCRSRDDERKGWAWRYVADMGQYGTEVFDNVVELLQWYETLHKPDLEDLDVWMRDIFKN